MREQHSRLLATLTLRKQQARLPNNLSAAITQSRPQAESITSLSQVLKIEQEIREPLVVPLLSTQADSSESCSICLQDAGQWKVYFYKFTLLSPSGIRLHRYVIEHAPDRSSSPSLLVPLLAKVSFISGRTYWRRLRRRFDVQVRWVPINEQICTNSAPMVFSAKHPAECSDAIPNRPLSSTHHCCHQRC